MGLIYNFYVKKSYRILLFLFILFLASCATVEKVDITSSSEENLLPESEITEESIEEQPATDPIKKILDTMTADEKIGQLIIINVREDSSGKPFTAMNDELSQRIDRIKPGGVILFGGSIVNIPQITGFIEELQSISNIPLFISADVEGGSISRLHSSDKMHATLLPDNIVIGRKGDTYSASVKGRIIGRELFALGINLNLAPVADVLTNPANTVIGPRSFGTDPQMVSEMISSTVLSMREEKVGTVLKHFPGHGDTLQDTHTGTVSVNHNLERLSSTELLPFLSGINAGTDGIMTAHILVPEITGNQLPSTLSHKMVTEILRGSLGFNGIVMTDSMGMGAITRRWSGGEAALMAVEAGIDLILNPHTADQAFDALQSAYEKGRISEERLNASLYRILKSKMELEIMNHSGQYSYHNNYVSDPQTILGSVEHNKLAEDLF